jgi:predicted ATPase
MLEETLPLDRLADHADRFVLLSGCSGGGKSALLSALRTRGFAAFEEPGREVVREQLLIDGPALPGATRRSSPSCAFPAPCGR